MKTITHYEGFRTTRRKQIAIRATAKFYLLPMKLRDHPLMNSQPLRNWPPVWCQVKDGNSKHLPDGILKYVYANSALSTRCFLVAKYENKNYVGTMIFNDKELCAQITTLLKGHIGRTINEIGDLDIADIVT